LNVSKAGTVPKTGLGIWKRRFAGWELQGTEILEPEDQDGMNVGQVGIGNLKKHSRSSSAISSCSRKRTWSRDAVYRDSLLTLREEGKDRFGGKMKRKGGGSLCSVGFLLQEGV